jgi:sugar phosphate isomerase/epimerase
MQEPISNVCIHSITTKPWSIEECVHHYTKEGFGGISVWRNTLENRNINDTGKLIRDHGLEIISLVRGGFFPSVSAQKRQKSMDDNHKAIEEAAALGAPLIVLVCGADPGQSLEKSRDQIKESIAALIPDALAANVKLAIEPLHPVYAGDRSAINTMRQANDMAAELNSISVGVAVDVYHVWWDPDLEYEIQRCGNINKLFAYHICDWKLALSDVLNDRGLMGEGCININQITKWVRKAGFEGMEEIEIFSNLYWSMDQHEYLKKIKSSYLNLYK